MGKRVRERSSWNKGTRLIIGELKFWGFSYIKTQIEGHFQTIEQSGLCKSFFSTIIIVFMLCSY